MANCGLGLLPRHGRNAREVFRTGGNTPVDYAIHFRTSDAGVDDSCRGTDAAGKDVDGGASSKEVPDHLAGNHRWIRADTFFCDAMVSAEYKDGAAIE